jgi:hypothetical protein
MATGLASALRSPRLLPFPMVSNRLVLFRFLRPLRGAIRNKAGKGEDPAQE